MKYLAFIFFIVFTSVFQTEYRLQGNYKIEYEKPYDFKNGKIFFGDTSFVKTTREGGKIYGKVEYVNCCVYLTTKNSTEIIDISKQDMEKDTMGFGTKETDPKKVCLQATCT